MVSEGNGWHVWLYAWGAAPHLDLGPLRLALLDRPCLLPGPRLQPVHLGVQVVPAPLLLRQPRLERVARRAQPGHVRLAGRAVGAGGVQGGAKRSDLRDRQIQSAWLKARERFSRAARQSGSGAPTPPQQHSAATAPATPSPPHLVLGRLPGARQGLDQRRRPLPLGPPLLPQAQHLPLHTGLLLAALGQGALVRLRHGAVGKGGS